MVFTEKSVMANEVINEKINFLNTSLKSDWRYLKNCATAISRQMATAIGICQE